MRRLYLYAFLNGLQFTYTTWLAFVLAHGGNPGWAEASYHLGILLSEVPTGAVADLLGRRTSMLIGLAIQAAVAGGYFLISGTFSACVLMFISGLAGTFLSGADTALLYETAVDEGGALAGQKALANASALTVGALALAPALAGFLYQWHMWAPAVAKGITSLVTLAVVWGIKEKPVERQEHIGLFGQMGAAVAVLRSNPWALSLVVFGWVYNTGLAMMGQYGQAYMPFMGLTMGATGIIFALSQGSGTLGSAMAGRLGRVTAGRMLRFGPLLVGGFIFAMGVSGGRAGLPLAALAGAACFVLSGVTDGMLWPIHQHRLNAAIPSAQRATILSLSSAGFSMFMTVTFPAASYLAIPHIYLATGAVTLLAAVVWMARRWSY